MQKRLPVSGKPFKCDLKYMLLQQAFHNYAHIIQHIIGLFEVVNVYVKLLFMVSYCVANI